MWYTIFEFGYEAHVNVSAAVGGLHSDETSVTTHQADQAHAVVNADTFYIGWADCFDALGDSGLETEWFVNDGDVVVDCLGDAHHADLQAALCHLFTKHTDTAVRAVTTNYIYVVDTLFQQGVQDPALIST